MSSFWTVSTEKLYFKSRLRQNGISGSVGQVSRVLVYLRLRIYIHRFWKLWKDKGITEVSEVALGDHKIYSQPN